MEIHLLNLVAGMVERGYEVFVVCPWGEMVEKYFDAGAAVRVDHPRLDIDPFYIFRLVRFIRQNRIEILHAHQLKTVVNGLIAAKIAGVPLKIAHIHTPLSQWRISPLKKKINIFVNRVVTNFCADRVIALTSIVREERIRKEGIRSEKIVVIPNAVKVKLRRLESAASSFSAPRFSTPSKNHGFSSLNGSRGLYSVKVKGQKSKVKTTTKKSKLTVGTLGRLTVEKGHKIFLAAAKKVISNVQCPMSKLNFIVAGEGNLRSELEQQAKRWGIESKISFLGFVPEEKKFEVLSSFDIFVFPSLAEGFGIALIEAMAVGLPCVVSDLPVLKEVCGEAAMFFRTGNGSDLAEKVIKLIEDDDRRWRLGRKARRRVEKRYSMERFVENYDHLYQQ
jgi:glycosyltransferase involved in cell wall biosynthesis